MNQNPNEKCKHCSKTYSEHTAKNRLCPLGKKHRSLGYTQYNMSCGFESSGKFKTVKQQDFLL